MSLVQLRKAPERLLILLRLGDSLADVTAGAVGAYMAYMQWNMLGLALAVVVVAIVVLVMGELVPMAIGMHRSVRIALIMAPPLLWLTQVFRLPLFALETIA